MKNNLTEQLKKLRAIEPDPHFARTTKRVIFGASTHRVSFKFPVAIPAFPRLSFSVWAWSGVALTAVLFAVLVTPLMIPKPTFSASLDETKLIQEYGNLPINIELKEISYDQTVSQTITSAITEVSDTRTKHLNPELITAEEEEAILEEENNARIDSLLETVIQ